MNDLDHPPYLPSADDRFPVSAIASARAAGKPDSMHRILREATRSDHALLDRAISELNLAEPAGYGRFLHIHQAALCSLAGRWRDDDQPDFSKFVACLADDLLVLGQPASSAATIGHRAKAESLRQWGVSYVIRGSRLGGAVLRQGVPAGYPVSYLQCEPQLSWARFLRELEHEAGTMSLRSQRHLIRGAKRGFAAFASAAGIFGATQ